jgi:YD repeat-containing protein
MVVNAERAAEEDRLIRSIRVAQGSTLETNPLGMQTTYSFTDGQLTDVSGIATANCAARSRSRTYDGNGNEDIVTDFNGNKVNYLFNGRGQATQIISGYQSGTPVTTNMVWDPTHNRKTKVTVAGDSETTYAYTTDNRLKTVSVKNLSPHGVANQVHTWTWTYTEHPSGIVQTIVAKGPDNVALTYTYSALGDLTTVVNALGHTTTYSTYNALGQPGRITGPNGDITDYAYYPGGLLKSVTTHLGGASTTTYTYAKGLLDSVTTGDGVVTTYDYDTARRLTTVSRNELNGTATREIGYNLNSNPTSVRTYRGASLRFSAFTDYDELGRPIRRYGNAGQNFRSTYDANGNLATTKDSLNRTTSYAYDALNRLTTVTDPLLGETAFQYEPERRDHQLRHGRRQQSPQQPEWRQRAQLPVHRQRQHQELHRHGRHHLHLRCLQPPALCEQGRSYRHLGPGLRRDPLCQSCRWRRGITVFRIHPGR